MTAVTVTSEVMSVPELVMNCLLPLITHCPSMSAAFVRVPPASLPASASVRPNPASRSPLASSGSHRSRWASVPKWRMGIAPSETPASSVIATLWSTFASSSIARQSAKWSPPMPPNASGIGRPKRPISAMPATTAEGNEGAASCSAATGATTVRANAATVSASVR